VARDERRATVDERPEPGATRRATIDGTPLAYLELGEAGAEPVVLLHGYMGSRLSWRHQLAPLSAAHRVIAVDWFGWGDSGRNLALRYDYDSEVERLERVLAALGLGRCNLFGHDYGGYLALGLCQRRPHLVRRLALLASRAHGTFNRTWRSIFGLIGTAGRRPSLARAMARLPLAAVHRLSVRRELGRGVFDERCLDHYAGWMSHDGGGAFWTRFMAEYRVEPRADLDAGLAAIRCPTAVIWGSDDAYLPPAIATHLAATIAGAELTMLNAGHFVMEERPQEVLLALLALLGRAA
jgi:pimeloyl-ACP methyl ester carboxylesterase